VADCVKAMVDVVDRAGDGEAPHRHRQRRPVRSYGFVRDFVGTVSEAGCQVFIVHARNAWLKGLSRRKTAKCRRCATRWCTGSRPSFQHLTIAINGGITTSAQVQQQLQHVDGVMLGREAYHNPWWLASGMRVF
jgi:tRNA-dihydrouridine synthase A